jgi:DNA-binding GntR family transcriptional regulator
VIPETASAISIPRSTFASIVTERLRAAIVNGSLEPGSQLSEVELATTFGVSRGTIHAAIQWLVHEGLLLSEPHRGVFVPVLTDDDVLDIYLAREALESAAVQQIVAAAKTEHVADNLDRLVSLMAESAVAGDWGAVGQHDLEFHTALLAGTGSERLQRMFRTVISETRLCRNLVGAAVASCDLVDEHRQIASMIRAGEVAQVLAILRKHFDAAVVTIEYMDNHRIVEVSR